MTLAAYRTRVRDVLGTAVDAATWTDALVDEAIRAGLINLDSRVVYEDSVTVTVAGQAQALSITDLRMVLAVAWPWADGRSFQDYRVRWRWQSPNTVYLERERASVGDVLRVRFTKFHRVQGLDGAAATTVPGWATGWVAWTAGAVALRIRARQTTENPALPREAGERLVGLARDFEATAREYWSSQETIPVWGRLGLDELD